MENKQIAIVNKVKEVETKSGVPFEIDITQVVNLAERGKKVTSVEHPDFAVIKKEMQQTRKYVSEYFMGARTEFNKLAKGVIEVERMVLSEFTPEEDRLIILDKAEKERLIQEARAKTLPEKRERITTVGIEFSDAEILSRTDGEFEMEFALRLQIKLEIERQAEDARIAEANAKIEAEKKEIQRQKDEADRIEKARQEERARAEQELRIAKETSEREKKEAEERVKREEEERIAKAEREKKEAEDAEKERLANKKYQDFLGLNKYNEKTDIIVEGKKIYRFVAEYIE